jgi:hypothetical protein
MKLLGILRLLVEGSKDVASALGEERPDVLAQIINFGAVEAGGPGPKAESGRLLAGIIKNSQSKKVRFYLTFFGVNNLRETYFLILGGKNKYNIFKVLLGQENN